MTTLERALLRALQAITVTTPQGRVCFKTHNGIPMGMSPQKARLVKAALKLAEEKQDDE